MRKAKRPGESKMLLSSKPLASNIWWKSIVLQQQWLYERENTQGAIWPLSDDEVNQVGR